MLSSQKTAIASSSSKKVPLSLALVIPFLLQISAAVGLTAWFSIRNSQQAVNHLAEELLNKTNNRILDQLKDYTTIPPTVTQLNANALRLGQLELNNLRNWRSHLFHQHQLYSDLTYIYFGSDRGEYVEFKKQADGSFELSLKDSKTSNQVYNYVINAQGNLSSDYYTTEYDPRQRPWYQQAQKKRQPLWTKVYEFTDIPPSLGISFVRPYFDQTGKLQGVLGADFTLGAISQFLSQLKIGDSGKTFIIERTGRVIASSVPNSWGDKSLKDASQNPDPLIQITAQHLTQNFTELSQIQTRKILSFTHNKERYLVQVTPFSEQFGLDWLVVSVVPESDFTALLQANTQKTILLCILALAVATGLGIFTSRWIASPIKHLSLASQAIAQGEFHQQVEIASIAELDILARSFNQMSDQLQTSWRSLEDQVNARTQQLQQEIKDREAALRERQLLEEKLRSSEAEIRAFFEAMTDIVLIIDRSIQNIKAAPTNPDRLYPPGTDILDQTLKQLLGDRSSEFQEPIDRALNTQQTVTFEYSLLLNNRLIWFSANIIPISDHAVTWVARDITEARWQTEQRRQAEAALLATERKFHAIFDQTFQFIGLLTPDGTIIEANQTALQAIGKSRSEIIGLPFWETPWWTHSPSLQQKLRTAIAEAAQGQFIRFETEHFTPYGTAIAIDFSLKPVFDETGQVVLLIPEGRDITDRKQAEAELRRSEERWQLAIRGSNDGIYDWKLTTGEAFYSLRCQEILGYHQPELGNRITDWQNHIHPDDQDSVNQTLQAHLNRQTPYYDVEYRVRCLDNRYKWILTRGQALWDETGTPIRLVGSHTDITDRKQREEALRLIVEGTASTTGHEFFRSCVRHLAQVLQVRYALVTEIVNHKPSTVRTLAFWTGEDWSDPIEYSLQGTPCETVLTGQCCYYPNGVTATFPEDQELINLGVESYLGIPLFDSNQQILGHLSVMDNAPMNDNLLRKLVLRIFAARASAELERQHKEAALQNSEQRYELATRAAKVGVWEWNLQTQEFYLDPNLKAILGYQDAEIPNDLNAWVQYIYPEDRETVMMAAQDYLDGKIPEYVFEHRMLHKEGSIRWILVRGSALRNSQGQVIRMMGTDTDITDRKQAEIALQHQAAIDSLLGRVAQAFLDRDADTAIDETLQVLSEMAGSEIAYLVCISEKGNEVTYSRMWHVEGILGPFEEFFSLPVTQFPWFYKQITTAQPIHWQTLDQLPPEAAAEQAFWQRQPAQSLVAVPLLHQEQVIGSLGLISVSQAQAWGDRELNLLKRASEIIAIGLARRAAEIAQQQATEAALAANQAKSEFLANMSHELRTPLTAILGLTEVLQDEVYGSLTDKQHQKLATIERSGRHLLELINDVLDLAKIESGKLELQLAPTHIQELCDNSLTFVRQQAHQKQIHLNAYVPSRLGTVLVDERRMRQVLINLLSNAVKFTPEGGDVWIEVEADPETEVLQFRVLDTGIGIAPENMGKLFQPFVQLDSSLSRRYTGTGLGLALVRQVVELHGGSVALESEVGKGSQFTVFLPWQPEERQQQINLEASQAATTEAWVRRSPMFQKVLIVEDSAPAAEQVARYLAEVGVVNSTIHNLGTGTLEKAIAIQPDAVILDLQLPDRSGWDVLAQLKANPSTQKLPVLIISVVDQPARPQELGICEYLVKPFSRSQFQAALRKLVLASQRLQPVTPAESQASPLILLAEDNETNISTIMEYLEVRGYRVAIALNGREAVEMTTELQPHLVLMDIQMPEMDGLEATRQLRTLPQFTRLPIIALTSLAMPGDREKCLEAGVNEYLAKPVSLKKLVEAIAYYLKQANSVSQA